MTAESSTTAAERAPVRVWQNRNFRRYWYGHSVSQFGDRITELALPLIAVLTLDATPAQLGVLTAATWLPNLLSLLIGSWADHQPHKRKILVYADLSRALVIVAVPVAYAFDAISFPLLLVVAVGAGLGSVFFNTSYPPFFVTLVTKPEYVDANAKLSISRSGSFIAGPAIGGVLDPGPDRAVTLLVDAATFLYSALVIGRLDLPDRPVEAKTDEPLRRRIWKGARFVLSNRYLRAGLGCSTTINFFTFMMFALHRAVRQPRPRALRRPDRARLRHRLARRTARRRRSHRRCLVASGSGRWSWSARFSSRLRSRSSSSPAETPGLPRPVWRRSSSSPRSA